MTQTTSKPQAGGTAEKTGTKILRLVLTERPAALLVMTIALVATFYALGEAGYLYASFDLGYMSSSLQAFVPVALLALAEMFVIISGRSGIDLSVGAMVSLAGMLFGYLVQIVALPLGIAIIITVAFASLLGGINGILVGYFNFPPLIATLASSYAYASLALIVSNSTPISGPQVAATHDLTASISIGTIDFPLQVVTFLLPAAVLSWLLLDKTAWGRSLLAIGTNDVAAKYAAQKVRSMRASAYLLSGFLCGIAAVVNVAQFASARPDAGTAGNGMALPAITIAVLGGVLIQGGAGRISGVLLGALLVTWLNAALLISFEGTAGPRTQLLALGLVLISAILVNSYAARKYHLR